MNAGGVPSEQAASTAGAPSEWNTQKWHWEERNANDFAKTALSAIFKDVVFDLAGDAGKFSVTDVTKCTGEAYCNLRKGKKNYGHDMQMKLQLVVRRGDAVVADGGIELPEVASDEPALVLNVSLSKGDDALKAAVKAESKAPFLAAHAAFKAAFQEAF